MEKNNPADSMNAAILALRQQQFEHNRPFLILSEKLPKHQAYYEYADGRIEIRHTSIENDEYHSVLVRTLTEVEAFKIRRDNGLR